jgi:hypothetical protein
MYPRLCSPLSPSLSVLFDGKSPGLFFLRKGIPPISLRNRTTVLTTFKRKNYLLHHLAHRTKRAEASHPGLRWMTTVSDKKVIPHNHCSHYQLVFGKADHKQSPSDQTKATHCETNTLEPKGLPRARQATHLKTNRHRAQR